MVSERSGVDLCQLKGQWCIAHQIGGSGDIRGKTTRSLRPRCSSAPASKCLHLCRWRLPRRRIPPISCKMIAAKLSSGSKRVASGSCATFAHCHFTDNGLHPRSADINGYHLLGKIFAQTIRRTNFMISCQNWNGLDHYLLWKT